MRAPQEEVRAPKGPALALYARVQVRQDVADPVVQLAEATLLAGDRIGDAVGRAREICPAPGHGSTEAVDACEERRQRRDFTLGSAVNVKE